MRRAITFGSFDMLHYGHLRLLLRVSQMADQVIVGLATDEIIFYRKKQNPFYSYDVRREMLLHTRYVDEVLRHEGPIDGAGPVLIIQQKIDFIFDNQIDLVVIGSDYVGGYDFLKPYCEVLYLERTQGISSSEIRTAIEKNDILRA
jgi:glycerol-3-phosphate cytidylyltransferase